MENTPRAHDHSHNQPPDTTGSAGTHLKAFVPPRVERLDALLDVTGFEFPAES